MNFNCNHVGSTGGKTTVCLGKAGATLVILICDEAAINAIMTNIVLTTTSGLPPVL